MARGSCYKSFACAAACKALNLKHIRTKPYTTKTNGTASPSRPPRTSGGRPLDIQTALREWAHARAYQTSDQRKRHLPDWTHMYNWHRPHAATGAKPPISRLGLSPDNLLKAHN